MIAVCFVVVTLIAAPDPSGRPRPDRLFRVYRGPNTAYGEPEREASGRTFGGARAVIIGSRGSLYVRETPEEIDRKPCHEPK